MDPRVLIGLLFWPRGGSAQVARYLALALERSAGWRASIAVGSLGAPGDLGNADTFFDGLDVIPARYDDAVAAWRSGADPMDAPMPMHASYEARADVPDRVLTSVSPGQHAHAVRAWCELLRTRADLEQADVAHLNHLTPIHDAVHIVRPELAIVTHLHGTELKLLAAIERGELVGDSGAYAAHWVAGMRRQASMSARVIVISPHDRAEALRLLPIAPELIVQRPNGVDVTRFRPANRSAAERRALWRQWLVEDPQGWDEQSRTPGSIRYTDAHLDAAFGQQDAPPRPVLLFVGRFLGFKRVPLLVRAYARARELYGVTAPLVIWGGAPGEWEGEHPHSVARDLGVKGLFFAGWRGHEDLPRGLSSADVFVAPSVDEPFGQVYLEAMACGVPVIGTLSGGPPSFVNVDASALDGWLVAPDDEDALAVSLAEAANDAGLRAARGANAVRHVREQYSWDGLARSFADIYDAARG